MVRSIGSSSSNRHFSVCVVFSLSRPEHQVVKMTLNTPTNILGLLGLGMATYILVYGFFEVDAQCQLF